MKYYEVHSSTNTSHKAMMLATAQTSPDHKELRTASEELPLPIPKLSQNKQLGLSRMTRGDKGFRHVFLS